MNLYEQLTISGKLSFKNAFEKHPALMTVVQNDFENNFLFYHLKYETVFNLNMLGILNGYAPNEIRKLFND